MSEYFQSKSIDGYLIHASLNNPCYPDADLPGTRRLVLGALCHSVRGRGAWGSMTLQLVVTDAGNPIPFTADTEQVVGQTWDGKQRNTYCPTCLRRIKKVAAL